MKGKYEGIRGGGRGKERESWKREQLVEKTEKRPEGGRIYFDEYKAGERLKRSGGNKEGGQVKKGDDSRGEDKYGR